MNNIRQKKFQIKFQDDRGFSKERIRGKDNRHSRNAANEFKALTQRNRDASVSEKSLMGFHVPSDAFDPKNGIESWPSEYNHPKRKKVNQNIKDKKGEKNGTIYIRNTKI